MKKKFKDIIPPDKRSIRNIPLPARAERSERVDQYGMASQPKSSSMDGIKPAHRAHAYADNANHANHADHTDHSTQSAHIKIAAQSGRKPKGFTPSPEIQVADDGHGSYGSYGEFNANKKHDWRVWAGIAIVVLVVGYFISLLFIRADITINLAKYTVALADTSIPLNKVTYEAVTGDITKTVTVKANGSQKISKSATGTVIIYNSSNTTSQPLAINTRLETPDGHIFKTDKAVTVPAVRTVGGKKTAGSVEVTITADKPGEGYNLGLKDFTLIGFKGTANYENFYARSKTPLAGGFVGTAPDVDQTELANTILSLKREIEDSKRALIVEKIQEIVAGEATGASAVKDYIYIPEMSIVEYSNIDTKQSKDGKSAEVTISGKVTALVLSNASLAKYLKETDTMPKTEPESSNAGTSTESVTGAGAAQERYAGDFVNVSIKLPSGLTSKSLVTAANMSSTNLAVTASGTAAIFSTVDERVLTTAVSRLSRESALSIIKSLVDADMIEVRLKPWWFSTLPSADKIQVIIEK